MKIEMEMLDEDGRNCLEIAAVSVAKWWGMNYELIFCEAWGFVFNPPHGHMDGSIGKYLNSDWGEMRGYAEKYAGMGLVIHEEKSPEEFLSMVMGELEAGRPSLVYIDIFWCPWMHHSYQKNHQGHYCLAVGYEEDGTICCLDAAANYMEFKLPENDMLNGCQRCITFVKNPEPQDIDWQGIIENAYARLQASNAFESMRNFAEQLEKSMDIQLETEGYDDGWGAPLINQITRIKKGRVQFAKVLDWISKSHGVKEYSVLSERLMEVSHLWARVYTLLSAAYYEPVLNDDVRREIGEIIKECADCEENAAGLMFKVSRGDQVAISDGSNRTIKSVTYIDIEKYFNNNAFAPVISNKVRADFTGTGEYFLTEGLPERNEWEIKDMKFFVPNCADGINDNISWDGQRIDVPSIHARGLMLLGCGEWGDFSESMVLEYSDGATGEVPVDFTNWFFEPKYGEVVAWKGRAAIKKEEGAEVLDYYRRMFAKTYWLKKEGVITGIRLPRNKNMHVFAISLSR